MISDICLVCFGHKADDAYVASNSNEEAELPIPKPKGAYNLDFLDNLDDPNFNPFETKSNIVVAFGESNDTDGTNNVQDVRQETEPPVKKTPTTRRKVATASKKKVANQNIEGKDSESKEEKPKKVMPPKHG